MMIDTGRTPSAVAKVYGVSPALLYRVLKGQIGYSVEFVKAVMGGEYQEVRLIVPRREGVPDLPPILALDVTLVPHEGGVLINAVPGLTLQEVAELAECTDRTTQRYAKRGVLPTVELAGRRFVPEADARAWAAWYRAKEEKGAA